MLVCPECHQRNPDSRGECLRCRQPLAAKPEPRRSAVPPAKPHTPFFGKGTKMLDRGALDLTKVPTARADEAAAEGHKAEEPPTRAPSAQAASSGVHSSGAQPLTVASVCRSCGAHSAPGRVRCDSCQRRLETRKFLLPDSRKGRKRNAVHVLICPGMPPLELEPGAEALLGRASSCEMVLAHELVSRRHARIREADGQFMLEDLGSSNGTFLNGKRVEEPTALCNGDTLLLGGVHLEYQVQLGWHRRAALLDLRFDDAETRELEQERVLERMHAEHAALYGDLAELGLISVLLFLRQNGRSGCLHVDWNDGEGDVCLVGGRLHAARLTRKGTGESLTGREAMVQLGSQETGHFRFDNVLPEGEANLELTIEELEHELAAARSDRRHTA